MDARGFEQGEKTDCSVEKITPVSSEGKEYGGLPAAVRLFGDGIDSVPEKWQGSPGLATVLRSEGKHDYAPFSKWHLSEGNLTS